MEIQPVHINHLEEVFNIFQNCKKTMENEDIFQWTENYPRVEHLSEDISQRHLYGLYKQKQCLGVISLNTIQDPQYKLISWEDINGNPLIIHRFAVEPSFQHLGLGRKLMDFAEEYAVKGIYTSIRFDAYSGNQRTLNFYEKRGYLKKGEVYFPGRNLPFYCFEKLI